MGRAGQRAAGLDGGAAPALDRAIPALKSRCTGAGAAGVTCHPWQWCWRACERACRATNAQQSLLGASQLNSRPIWMHSCTRPQTQFTNRGASEWHAQLRLPRCRAPRGPSHPPPPPGKHTSCALPRLSAALPSSPAQTAQNLGEVASAAFEKTHLPIHPFITFLQPGVASAMPAAASYPSIPGMSVPDPAT